MKEFPNTNQALVYNLNVEKNGGSKRISLPGLPNVKEAITDVSQLAAYQENVTIKVF